MITNPRCTASAIGRGAGRFFAAVLLGILTLVGVVPQSAATEWTFDWTTAGGWTSGSTAPRVYANVAGSGYDIRVSIGMVNGAWSSYGGGPCGGNTPVVPCLNNSPGQGPELFLGINFSNLTTSNITLLYEFCQPGATVTSCTAKPASVRGVAVRDIDRSNANNYMDVVTVTARDSTGTLINPDALTQFTAAAPGWARAGTGQCATAAVAAGSHGISGGPAGATTTSICTSSNSVSATGTGGGAGNESDPSTWASFNFATKSVRSVLLQYTPGDCGGGCGGNPSVQVIWLSDLVFSDVVLATHAVIADVRAYAAGGQSWFEWETASEIGTTGFNVYRLDASTDTFVKLNDRLLPALGATRQGGVYRFADPLVVPGVATTYGIEEIEASGNRRVYGPFSVVGGSAKPAPRRAIAEVAPVRPNPRSTPGAQKFERVAHASDLAVANPAPAASISPKNASSGIANPGSAMRIRVEDEGLYVITADQIATALGANPIDVRQWIAGSQLRLQQGGQQVAWKAGSQNDRLFFYGEAVSGNDSVYTRYNVYWLDQGAGLAMGTAGAPRSGAAPAGQSFPSSVHVAQYGKPLYFLFTDPDADLWYWDYVWAGGGATDFRVPVPDVAGAGGTATLTVTMLGASSDQRSARLTLNPSSQNCDLGASPAWKGIAPQVFTTQPFAASCLNSGDNIVRMTADVPSGADSFFWVKAFDVGYSRAYRALGDRLRLRGAGNAVVRVDGFSRSDIVVLDISDPRKPRWMSNATVSSGAPFAVSFAPTGSVPTYLAAVAQPPYSVEAGTPSTLKSTANAASYLVLTPQSLRTGADLLAAYRGGKVVGLQDIYDEFNYGIANPHAIRDFLAYAYRNWSTRPSNVALLGKGTIDPKEYRGFAYNLFPVLLAPTPNGLFNSDNRYADFNDDGVPDIAIGRIPARTVDDVTNYVAKLRAYETAFPAVGMRTGLSPALLVADNPDPEAGNFTADSLLVAQALQSRKVAVTTVNRAASASGNEVRQTVVAALNSTTGVGLFNYFGHGAYFELGHDPGDPLFSNDDVSLLDNGARLPIFTAFTCEVGDGSYPGTTSLVETLLWRKGGGAVAAFAPTGLSVDEQASTLSLSLVDALAGPNPRATLGEAAVSALADLARKGGQRYMMDIYQVIGDPALRIPR